MGTIYETSPKQREVIVVGAAALQDALGWAAQSVIVDNPTNQHLLISDAGRWVAPGVRGACMDLNGSMVAAARFVPPPLVVDPQPINGQQAQLVFYAERQPPAAGSALAVTASLLEQLMGTTQASVALTVRPPTSTQSFVVIYDSATTFVRLQGVTTGLLYIEQQIGSGSLGGRLEAAVDEQAEPGGFAVTTFNGLGVVLASTQKISPPTPPYATTGRRSTGIVSFVQAGGAIGSYNSGRQALFDPAGSRKELALLFKASAIVGTPSIQFTLFGSQQQAYSVLSQLYQSAVLPVAAGTDFYKAFTPALGFVFADMVTLQWDITGGAGSTITHSLELNGR